jgi:hypothetical protein
MGVDLLGWEISMQPQIPGLLADGVLISFTAIALTILGITYRSEERRVGKECM